MAFENVGSTLPGVEAAADLSANQFRAVTIDGNGQVALATAATAPIAGILQNKPSAQGQAATVWGPGTVSKVVVGTGGATAGALATPAADGLIDASTGNIVAGRFLETAAAGELSSLWMGPECGATAP